MTLVACDAVVRVTPDVRVMEIGGVVVPVATNALEHRIAARRHTDVADRANPAGVPVLLVEPRVRKRRPEPIGRGMAGPARRGDDAGDGGTGSSVIRYLPAQRRGALPSRGVATVTVQRRRSCTGVAQVAGDCGVHASQRSESGGAVVKQRAQPISHVMAV